MVGQVLKVHLISRIFDYSFQLEYSKEVSTVGIIPSQLVMKSLIKNMLMMLMLHLSMVE